MPYVAKDGTVHNSRPWNLERFVEIFWAFIAFIQLFFKTLTDPVLSGFADFNNRRNGPGGGPGGGGGGWGGGRGGPGGGGRGGPQRRIGRIATISDCQTPMAGGG
ncbi:glycine-rich selenoprotein-like [Chrysoperla carnea]|uniref:glycine-rich selenoprotein-like n=1 Tax=Chrysoperla carnea TaxID=189513 RepID=UPI001D0639D1|nr:glycine-rich selenoprotein-like [Chrysoperla carnea]